MTTAGQHTEELLPCRKCGSTDLELWDGKGTQAEMSCNNCGDSDGLQVSDLLEYKHRYSGNCDFSMETLSYPPHVVELAQAHLTIEWNKRTGSGQPPKPFQSRVKPWMDACFGPTISADKVERNHRFLEEALELVQACGATREECYQLVDYVYGRPDGDVNQEVGGVMITLAALCLGNGFDMHAAGETELVRVWGKIEQIRAKQAGKPKHSPLPQDVAGAETALAKEPDYKRLAYEFAELLGFCMDNLRPAGTGLVLDQNSGKTEPWRKWIARYIEKLPYMTIDHAVLEALDLPAKARRKRLAEIAAAKVKPTGEVPEAEEPKITVCSACLQASCWQGAFYCDDYKSAGTVEKTRSELEKLNLERPDYWQDPKAGAV